MTEELRTVIVVRRDLKMTRGKESLQVARAVMKNTIGRTDPAVQQWYDNDSAMVVVSVDSEQDLNNVIHKAMFDANLHVTSTIDHGRTMFNGVKTLTCAAIGPAQKDAFAGITDHLKLR